MNRKVFYVLIALLLLGGGFYLYDRSQNQAQAPITDSPQREQPALSAQLEQPMSNQESPSAPNVNTGTAPLPTDQESGGRFSDEQDLTGSATTHQVIYDGSNFSPKTLSVKAGDTVVFKNNGPNSFWPASGPHPVHTNYPEFDAKEAVAAGGIYQFIFTKIGIWLFHDHLRPAATGSITVSQ